MKQQTNQSKDGTIKEDGFLPEGTSKEPKVEKEEKVKEEKVKEATWKKGYNKFLKENPEHKPIAGEHLRF